MQERLQYLEFYLLYCVFMCSNPYGRRHSKRRGL